MNVGAGFVGRFSGRNRVIDDIAGLVHYVGRLRSIGYGRLLDHVSIDVQER